MPAPMYQRDAYVSMFSSVCDLLKNFDVHTEFQQKTNGYQTVKFYPAKQLLSVSGITPASVVNISTPTPRFWTLPFVNGSFAMNKVVFRFFLIRSSIPEAQKRQLTYSKLDSYESYVVVPPEVRQALGIQQDASSVPLKTLVSKITSLTSVHSSELSLLYRQFLYLYAMQLRMNRTRTDKVLVLS